MAFWTSRAEIVHFRDRRRRHIGAIRIREWRKQRSMGMDERMSPSPSYAVGAFAWQLQALQEARALAVAGDAEVLQNRRAQVAGGAAQP